MNYVYGDKKRVPIFTVKKIADGFKRAKENERVAKIIDRIEELYGDIANPKISQILIYSEKCGACTESLPLWYNITHELKRVLPTYISTQLEFTKYSKFGNQEINGEQFHDFWYPTKVQHLPIIMQNFEIVTKKVSRGKTYNAIKQLPKYFISYEGSISPYGFLSKIFRIENDFVNRISQNSSNRF